MTILLFCRFLGHSCMHIPNLGITLFLQYMQSAIFDRANFPVFKRKYTFFPSRRDGVHRTENFVEIIPVFSTFSNFFKKKIYIYIKAILCNFSMRLLKYF